MAEVRTEYAPRTVSPPGATLLDLLEERQLSQAELARRMGRPLKTVNEIIRGKAAITPDTALQLEVVLGPPAEFWNARERQYRAHLARVEQRKLMARSGPWARLFPLRAMERLGWIDRKSDPGDQVREMLQFFSLASVEQWPEFTRDCRASFRVSKSLALDEYSLLAWLRAGRTEGEMRIVENYDVERFRKALAEARSLTPSRPDQVIEQIRSGFAAAGVVLAILPELPRCRASGATMWISSSRAVIQLSLRHKTDDHFWFTLFHEAAHLILHPRRTVFVEGAGSDDDAAESEANRWACDFLVPDDEWMRFTSTRQFTSRRIQLFAEDLGIAPGIVVGRLQHERLLPFSSMNHFKKTLDERLHPSLRSDTRRGAA